MSQSGGQEAEVVLPLGAPGEKLLQLPVAAGIRWLMATSLQRLPHLLLSTWAAVRLCPASSASPGYGHWDCIRGP